VRWGYEMLEKIIEKKVCDYAKSKGMLTYKFTSLGTRAVCDRIIVNIGYMFFIEFKQLNKKPTPLQAKHHQLLASKKIIVYVIDNVELGKEIIDYEYINKGAKHHWNAVRNIDGN
jgi:hypothetical protein